MADRMDMRIIVIERMGDRAVDESGIHDVGLQAVAQDRGLGFAAKILGHFHQDVAQGLFRTPQSDSEQVKEAALGLVNHRFGKRAIGCFHGKSRQFFGYLHNFLLILSRSIMQI